MVEINIMLGNGTTLYCMSSLKHAHKRPKCSLVSGTFLRLEKLEETPRLISNFFNV